MSDWIEYATEGNDYVPIQRWGQDHWSTLAYLETRAVDAKGAIDNRRMRCNARLHRHLAHWYGTDLPVQDGARYPTRLAEGELIQHDDWSCLEDMVSAGFLRAWWRPVPHHPVRPFGGHEARIELTVLGQDVAAALRQYKARRGSYSEFHWQGT